MKYAKTLTIGALFSILTGVMKSVYAKKRLILSGVLSALCIVIGYLFLLVPNVEMITAAVFISGAIVGPGYGTLAGAVAELVYSLFNPYGAAAPPLLLVQVFCFALIGFMGGWAGRRTWQRSASTMILFGGLGLVLTLMFDLLTTLSFSLFLTDFELKKTAAFFISGAPFYLIHGGVNVIIFAAVVPWILPRLQSQKIQRERIV
jgi:energy-coupling factor transport system substrate-specific component